MRPGFTIAGVSLRGVTCCLPTRRMDNVEFTERLGEKAVADVTAMTGVETRYHVLPGQTAADLCLAAARRLLAKLDWGPETIDALIFVSQTPDQRLPATACTLHGHLDLSSRAQAFDVNLGCSGYVYGLWLAAALVNAGCRRVLLLAGDTSSRLVDPADRSTALLFGDAGSASAIEGDPAASPVHFVLGTDGKGGPHLCLSAGGYRVPPSPAAGETLFMDGAEVFGFTLRAVPALVRETLDRAGQAIHEIDAFVLHQANRFMLRHIAKKLAITPDRMPINIDRFGNTSSASIPLLLCTDLADQVRRNPCNLLLAGFGVGFSWAAASLRLEPLACAELVAP